MRSITMRAAMAITVGLGGLGAVQTASAGERAPLAEPAASRVAVDPADVEIARSLPPELSDAYWDVATNADLSETARASLKTQIASDWSFADQANSIEMQIGDWPSLAVSNLPKASMFLHKVGVWHDPLDQSGIPASVCQPDTPCAFPDDWDVKQFRVYLMWKPTGTTTLADLKKYFEHQNGKGIRLFVEGKPLVQGFGGLFGGGDFHAYVNDSYAVMSIARDAWYPATPPWPVWNVLVQLTEDSGLPIFDFDKWGNPMVVGYEAVAVSQRMASVVPPTKLKNFWTATIGQSVTSARCTTCHTMDTPAFIVARHNGLLVESEVKTEPSILVPGKEVYSCNNCHETQFDYLGASSPFEEGKWATPTQALDINWAAILNANPVSWPAEICNRMVQNMPTHELRKKHFHEDARLFWATEKGEIPLGHPSLPTAAPHDHDEFVRRFDVWNDSGAYCPKSALVQSAAGLEIGGAQVQAPAIAKPIGR